MTANIKLSALDQTIEEMILKNKALALANISSSRKTQAADLRNYISTSELAMTKEIMINIKLFLAQESMTYPLLSLMQPITRQQKANDIFHTDFFLGNKSFNIFFSSLFYSTNI
jgi:hypothetical protein